jgi:hypothetical protein
MSAPKAVWFLKNPKDKTAETMVFTTRQEARESAKLYGGSPSRISTDPTTIVTPVTEPVPQIVTRVPAKALPAHKVSHPRTKTRGPARTSTRPNPVQAALNACMKADPRAKERLETGRKLLTQIRDQEVGPVARIRYLAGRTNLVRREVLALALEFGINLKTASRQFWVIRAGKADVPQF